MKKYLVLLCVVALQACTTYTPIRENSNLASKAERIRSVVILPADVDINQHEFSGQVDLVELDQQYKQLAEDIVRDQLVVAGLKVLPFDFEKQMTENSEFAFSVSQCKQAMQALKKEIYSKPVAVEQKATFTNSIAEAANPVAAQTGADMVAYVSYSGFKKSSGKKAAEMTTAVILTLLTGSTPVAPPEGSSADLVLVEASTGELLWANAAGAPKLDASPVNALFKDFPAVSWGKPAAVAAPVGTQQLGKVE